MIKRDGCQYSNNQEEEKSKKGNRGHALVRIIGLDYTTSRIQLQGIRK